MYLYILLFVCLKLDDNFLFVYINSKLHNTNINVYFSLYIEYIKTNCAVQHKVEKIA